MLKKVLFILRHIFAIRGLFQFSPAHARCSGTSTVLRLSSTLGIRVNANTHSNRIIMTFVHSPFEIYLLVNISSLGTNRLFLCNFKVSTNQLYFYATLTFRSFYLGFGNNIENWFEKASRNKTSYTRGIVTIVRKQMQPTTKHYFLFLFPSTWTLSRRYILRSYVIFKYHSIACIIIFTFPWMPLPMSHRVIVPD